MTEADWLASTSPQTMLEFLRESGKASDRKLRLFAVACCLQIWQMIAHADSQHAVQMSEQYADGLVTAAQLRKAERKASTVASGLAFEATLMMRLRRWAAKDAAEAAAEVARKRLSPEMVAAKAHAAVTASPEKPKDQCGPLRDLFGNPFAAPRPIEAAWLHWNDGTVVRIAQGIYEERAFERLPILADALLDAGCDNEDLLAHCRQQEAVHARGCWVIDVLLGKE